MAKKDPFERFREATLGGQTNSPLKDALAKETPATPVVDTRVPVRNVTPAPVPAEPAVFLRHPCCLPAAACPRQDSTCSRR